MNRFILPLTWESGEASPLFRLRITWRAYKFERLSLSQAASLLGLMEHQFLDVGYRLEQELVTEVPRVLTQIASVDQMKILGLCTTQQLEIVLRMVEVELRLPKNAAFRNGMWQDLHMLTIFRLISVEKTDSLWRYRLNLGKKEEHRRSLCSWS